MDQGDDIPQTVQGVLEKSSFDVFFSPFDACNQKGLPKTPHILARVVHISIYFMCCTVELMFLLFFRLRQCLCCILLTNHLCHTYKRSQFFSLRWFCLQTVLSTIDSLMLYQMPAGLEKAQWLYPNQGWRTWMTIAWRCRVCSLSDGSPEFGVAPSYLKVWKINAYWEQGIMQ